jgi:thiosulfate dehydrogenase
LTLLLVFTAILSSCSIGSSDQATQTPGGAPSGTPSAAPAGALIPATGALDTLRQLPKDPNQATLPQNQYLADQIKLGYQIAADTPTHAGQYVGNGESCANCHLNVGQKDKGLPWVGVAAVFPTYNTRSGRLFSLEDRIRDCFIRSEAGTAPPYDSKELLAVAAYITWLSEGQPGGASPAWRGRNEIAKENLIPIDKLDPQQGQQLFEQQCVACHGQDGQGLQVAAVKPAPLWGPQSWNDGAGMARVYTLAGFIRYAMPYHAPGSLTDEQAQQLAAYINSQDRPAYPNKDKDYVKDPVPVDAVYYPQRYPDGNPLAK